MPRQSRIDAPGALHHVMIRGSRGRPSFGMIGIGIPSSIGSVISCWRVRPPATHIALVMRRLVLDKVSGHFGVDSGDLKSGSKARNVAKARAVLFHVGVRKGLTSASVAKELGMSPSAVSKLIVHAKQVSGMRISGAISSYVNNSRTSPYPHSVHPIHK